MVATAGHVDHGKSTLVRALTGIEPDRWAEERRRGLTIDLGFAWTTLPSGRDVAFVDVPGHERFLGNMLAGLGPAPVVLFVVAADSGWQEQSTDHANAVAALGISRGLIVVTKSDLAPDGTDDVVADTRARLADTGLTGAPVVAVSGETGAGLDRLREALDALLGAAPTADPGGPVRLWVDRAFTIGGAGTVVTGTLAAGTLTVGDELVLHAGDRSRRVTVRGLQREGAAESNVGPVSRVAVNLRGVGVDEVRRGDALLTPDGWHETAVVDVRRTTGEALADWPDVATGHLGTAAHEVRIRPFDTDHARLTLPVPLPLVHGDRLVVRDPGGRRILGGLQVLDADPPPLTRRGDGPRRAATLSTMTPDGDAATEVARRRAVHTDLLRRLHLLTPQPPAGVTATGPWWVADAARDDWAARLTRLVDDARAADPLTAGIPQGQARSTLAIPDDRVLRLVAEAAALEVTAGHVRRPGRSAELGDAEAAVAALESRLAAAPFDAPEADELNAAGLGPRELAAAERVGRLVRLTGGIVLLPSAPDDALRVLAGLEQPFTVSAAKDALGTTRRVAIPLLELLDARNRTRRLPDGRREVR